MAEMVISIPCKCTLEERVVERRILGKEWWKDLTRLLKGKNHHVFFDSFFTSEELLQDLVEDGILVCGTARKDCKGFPPALKQAKLKNRYG